MNNVTTPILTDELAKLAKIRTDWEKLIVRTNKKLYELLGGCVGLTETFSRDALVVALGDAFKVRKDTTDILIAVKLVLGADDKKASAYAKALENGMKAGQTSSTIANWLFVTGLEKARTLNNKKPTPNNQKTTTNSQSAASANDTISSPVIVEDEVSATNRAKEFLNSQTGGVELSRDYFPEVPFGDEMVLLVTAKPSGELVVTFATVDGSAIGAVKRTLGKELLADHVSAHSVIFSDTIADQQAELDAMLAAAKA